MIISFSGDCYYFFVCLFFYSVPFPKFCACPREHTAHERNVSLLDLPHTHIDAVVATAVTVVKHDTQYRHY